MDNEYNKLIAELISKIANGNFNEETDKLYNKCQKQSKQKENEAKKAQLIADIQSGNITPDTRELFNQIASFDTPSESTQKENKNIKDIKDIKDAIDSKDIKEEIPVSKGETPTVIEEPKSLSDSPVLTTTPDIQKQPLPSAPDIASSTTSSGEASIYSQKYASLATSEQRTPITLTPVIGEELDQNVPYDTKTEPTEVTSVATSSVNNFPYSREVTPVPEIESLGGPLADESKTRVLTPNPYTSSRVVTPGE